MVWIVGFAMLAGAWFVAGVATFLVTRSIVRRDSDDMLRQSMKGARDVMTSALGEVKSAEMVSPETILEVLRRTTLCACDACRDFWIDHGQEIQTLAEEASQKAVKAASQSAVN